ncbi:MAG: hypothetical protein HZA50_14650 [Planctomycetes bacterium]|nr:hypothetical protein [Planctomycetota bacterium]
MKLCQTNIEVSMEVCRRRNGSAREFYITARPKSPSDMQEQAGSLMECVFEELVRNGAAILQERIFAEPAAMDALLKARSAVCNGLDDGVPPTLLAVPANLYGAVSGIQVHAVAGCGSPEVLSVDNRPCGRLMKMKSGSYITGCGLKSDSDGSPADQAQGMLAKAEAILAQAGATLTNVVRTWMWLGGILGWYNEFNRVRRELFSARGLLGKDGRGNLPASTGIGIGPAGNRCCTMDLCAVTGGEKPKFILASSMQGPASKYGSAFSRAAVADTPAGKTIYISGTASIDAAGQTTHLDDPRGQIAETIKNVKAVLGDAGGSQEDVVQSMVYCKTPQVERIFRDEWGSLPIPQVIAIADVCRDNLLFEIEAAAMPGRSTTGKSAKSP